MMGHLDMWFRYLGTDAVLKKNGGKSAVLFFEVKFQRVFESKKVCDQLAEIFLMIS
jgi:hypothetical protein